MLAKPEAAVARMRAAIQEANYDVLFNTIQFDLPGAGPTYQIMPNSPLPAINGAVVSVGNQLIDRAYATDNAADVFVVLPAALPVGQVQGFQTWNQATAGGSNQPSAGLSFHGYILRPTVNANEYQVIYDSVAWTDPLRQLIVMANWVECGHAKSIVDLAWQRPRLWHRLLAQSLDPGYAPGALESITEIHIEHGPHALTQAWLLVGWLASVTGLSVFFLVLAGEILKTSSAAMGLETYRTTEAVALAKTDQGARGPHRHD